ncbi:Uncharacterized protein APZ42_002698 [Daphnia magna]|uniref:Uncharacterized protein n=1 Tax=Daphnia magna TaxID=35525 RepID=A0A164I3N4_9CRUS|nr:Uncharacterized protein APZ42_002698 [Daphnia magna]
MLNYIMPLFFSQPPPSPYPRLIVTHCVFAVKALCVFQMAENRKVGWKLELQQGTCVALPITIQEDLYGPYM